MTSHVAKLDNLLIINCLSLKWNIFIYTPTEYDSDIFVMLQKTLIQCPFANETKQSCKTVRLKVFNFANKKFNFLLKLLVHLVSSIYLILIDICFNLH